MNIKELTAVWTAIKSDIKILCYQQDCLAAALKTTHSNAVIISDPQSKEPRDTAEQLYYDSLLLANDILTIKMERTKVALGKNFKKIENVFDHDVHIKCQLNSLVDKVNDVIKLSADAIDHFKRPRNALDEQASTALLSVLSWFRIEDHFVDSVHYNTMILVNKS